MHLAASAEDRLFKMLSSRLTPEMGYVVERVAAVPRALAVASAVAAPAPVSDLVVQAPQVDAEDQLFNMLSSRLTPEMGYIVERVAVASAERGSGPGIRSGGPGADPEMRYIVTRVPGAAVGAEPVVVIDGALGGPK